jgi:hypothetical protein
MSRARIQQYERRWNRYVHRCRKLGASPLMTVWERRYLRLIARWYEGYYGNKPV